jgi:hypothetical protein
MATKVNFKGDNPKKDSHFKKFVIFLFATIILLVLTAISFEKNGDGTFPLVLSGIAGVFMLYNFIMYRYNR